MLVWCIAWCAVVMRGSGRGRATTVRVSIHGRFSCGCSMVSVQGEHSTLLAKNERCSEGKSAWMGVN